MIEETSQLEVFVSKGFFPRVGHLQGDCLILQSARSTRAYTQTPRGVGKLQFADG